MAEANNTPGCSDATCQVYSILNNTPRHHKVLSDVLHRSQFCEAFFHVPEGLDGNTEMQCLDKRSCRVKKSGKKDENSEQKQPTFVVSFVVLKIGNDEKYKALFENCEQQKPTKHAEEFFIDELGDPLAPGLASLTVKEERKVMKMYITLLPCHYSTEDCQRSCTEKLIEFYEKDLKKLHIDFIVKPTFISKVYWSVTDEMAKDGIDEINNAKEGLKKLFDTEGIQVEAMKEEDWTFLKDHLCPSIELFPGSTYEESERKKLDDFIREFLEEIGSGSASTPRGSNPPPRDSDSTPRDSNPPSRDSAQQSSDIASTPRGSNPPSSDSVSTSDSDSTASGNASRASGTVSRSSDNASGAIPKERKKDEDKKKETKHGKLASNQQLNKTTCSCKNMCVQRDGEKKKRCPCKTADQFCHEACKCGTPKNPCKNKA